VPHPLIEADVRANLCLHDIADDPSSIYTLPMSYLVAIIDGLQGQGIADRVRVYFDDGYASVTEAVQTLRTRAPEMEIVLALTLEFVGQPGRIGWSDIDPLHEAGVSIAAHGREHLHMADLSDEQNLAQLVASRDALAAYGADEFVFPYGSYDERVIELNDRQRLFKVMTTIDYGWDYGQALRPRLMVTTEMSAGEAVARLASAD
jgi:peptidoglycan/xylan/chitin deacetylase (PgdA/CDA1 family)